MTAERLGFTRDETVDGFLEKLNRLDFGPLAYKLMHREEGPGLSLDQAADAITKYKGFLLLSHACRGRTISPSRYVDFVWHNHILDTELYYVQCGMLYGRYLHHFPFFGKRNAEDERQLLEAAEFTKGEAMRYFNWDDDDWCGTGRKPKWPRPGTGFRDLAQAILPAAGGATGANPDVVTIQAGNFRHTVEYAGSYSESGLYWGSRWVYLERLLKLPVWVVVCMPVNIDVLGEISAIPEIDRLDEFARMLIDQRPVPEGFSNELVRLQIAN